MNNPSREIPGSMITARDREFNATRSLSRLGQIIPSRLRVPLSRLGFAGLLLTGAANIVPDKDPRGNMLSPRTAHAQEVPTKPDPGIVYGPDGQPVGRVLGITDENPTAVSPAPGEGGEELSLVEQWIKNQPIVDTVTFKDPLTNEARPVINMRATLDSTYQITINPELKEALATWAEGQIQKHQTGESIDYVLVGSIPNSVFPDATQWSRIFKKGMALSSYKPADPGRSLNLVAALPDGYGQYPADAQEAVTRNMGGVFMSSVFMKGEDRPISPEEQRAQEEAERNVPYASLFIISPRSTIK